MLIDTDLAKYYPQITIKKCIWNTLYETVYEVFDNSDKKDKYLKTIPFPPVPEILQMESFGCSHEDIRKKSDSFLRYSSLDVFAFHKQTENGFNILPFQYKLIKHIYTDGNFTFYIMIITEKMIPVLNNLFQTYDEKAILQLCLDLFPILILNQSANRKIHKINLDNIYFYKGKYCIGDFFIKNCLFNYRDSLLEYSKMEMDYLPPEFFLDKQQTYYEIYSFGVLLYKLYNNNIFPYYTTINSQNNEYEKNLALCKKINLESLDPPINSDFYMSRIILKACDPNMDKRYQNFAEMYKDYQEYLKIRNFSYSK